MVDTSWLEARILSSRNRLHEARAERMAFERSMDVDDHSDALILGALMASESALAHELGMMLLKKKRDREASAA